MTTSNAPLPQNPHAIPLPQAIDMTATYRRNKEIILAPEFQEKEILPLSETFNRAAFDQLLSIPGCAGIRIYYGMDQELKIHVVVVAVNEANEDILPDPGIQNMTDESSDEPVIIDEGQRCPPICPEKKSALNS